MKYSNHAELKLHVLETVQYREVAHLLPRIKLIFPLRFGFFNLLNEVGRLL